MVGNFFDPLKRTSEHQKHHNMFSDIFHWLASQLNGVGFDVLSAWVEQVCWSCVLRFFFHLILDSGGVEF